MPRKERRIVTTEGNLIYMYSTTVFPVGTKLNLSHGSDGAEFFALQMTSMKCKDCKLDPVIGIEEHTEFTED